MRTRPGGLGAVDWRATFVRDLGRALAPGAALDKLWVSSAYTTTAGVKMLAPLIRTSREARAVLGYNAQTDWRALAQLTGLGVQVQIAPDPPGGIFHPKCLYAEAEAGTGWVLAGSGNLTRGGKEANVEAGLLVSGPRSLRALRDAHHFFVELTEVAVPLSEHLLGAIRTAQAERQQVAVSTEARLPHLPDLDPLLLLPLLPAQQRIRSSLAAQSLHHYIAHTPMNASYKMVIIGLLLLAPPGAVPIEAFARRFFQFYCLLRVQGWEAEQAGMGMARAPQMAPKEVLYYLRGAPREAFAGKGIVLYGRDSIELSPTIWAATAGHEREQLLQMAVDRLQQYYALHLGYQADFGYVLREAARVS